MIAGAIEEAERKTSGEIRVHIEPRLKKDAMDRAGEVFRRLKMHRTRDRNGVLILIAPNSRAFAIVGDTGIHRVASAGFWDETRDVMQAHFREDKFLEGVLSGIRKVAEALKVHFPHRPDDVNELPDDVSVSKE